MSVRYWWAESGDLGAQYMGPDTDVRYGERPGRNRATGRPWYEDDVTEVGALVLGDGNDALVIEGSADDLHDFVDRIRELLPDRRD